MAYKIISVSYGHGTRGSNGKLSPSGKLYDYGTDKEYRTGDVVVVPVTHPKSGKTYNTLAVVRLTSKLDSAGGQAKADHITDPKNGIKAKDVSERLEVAKRQGLNVQSDRDVNVRPLPGTKRGAKNGNWRERVRPKNSPRLI